MFNARTIRFEVCPKTVEFIPCLSENAYNKFIK